MRKLLQSFKYAWEGLVFGLKKERNLKIHFLATVVVILAALLTGISVVEWLIILLLIGGVISFELINSAIERAVDLITTEIHPLAKQAKDLAAGAVLVYAIVSAVVGLLIFIPKWFN